MINALVLGLMGCVPRYHAAPAMAPAELYSPLPVKHLQVDGVDLAYVDSGGSGPPLVFVHGLSSYMGFWEHQLPVFAEDHRVLALDLPGYGASGRPDAPYTPPWYASVLVGWMDELGLDSATFVGHSMGGQIVMTLALEQPGRVEALVLSAPAGFETFQPGHAAWMKDFWTEGRALQSREEDIRLTFTNHVFNVHDEGVERLIEERVRLGRHPDFRGTSVAVSRSIAGMLDFPVFERLGEISVPTLIVYGTDDRMIPNPVFNGGRTRSVAEAGHAAIVNSQLVMIDKAGHTVHHDAPARWNEAVSAFLEEL